MEEIIGRRVVGPVREGGEADRFIDCACGARLDMRRLDQVLAHEQTCPAATPSDDRCRPCPRPG